MPLEAFYYLPMVGAPNLGKWTQAVEPLIRGFDNVSQAASTLVRGNSPDYEGEVSRQLELGSAFHRGRVEQWVFDQQKMHPST